VLYLLRGSATPFFPSFALFGENLRWPDLQPTPPVCFPFFFFLIFFLASVIGKTSKQHAQVPFLLSPQKILPQHSIFTGRSAPPVGLCKRPFQFSFFTFLFRHALGKIFFSFWRFVGPQSFLDSFPPTAIPRWAFFLDKWFGFIHSS